MPQMAGPLVPHKFNRTTIVANSYVFFPGKVELPAHVLKMHKQEVEQEKARKAKQAEEMGLTLEEMANLEMQRQAAANIGTETDETIGDGEGSGNKEPNDEE